MENHKATKPGVNVGPSSTHQGKAISVAFPLQADDGQILVVFGSSTAKKKQKRQDWTLSNKTFWICA